jgi:hypothetical protein
MILGNRGPLIELLLPHLTLLKGSAAGGWGIYGKIEPGSCNTLSYIECYVYGLIKGLFWGLG